MTDIDTIQRLIRICKTCGLTYGELAAFARVSPTTARYALLVQAMPKRRRAREALQHFAATNISAQRRSELRLVD